MAIASLTHQSSVYVTEFVICFAFPAGKQNRVSELKFTTKVDGEENNVRQYNYIRSVFVFVWFLTNRRTFSP